MITILKEATAVSKNDIAIKKIALDIDFDAFQKLDPKTAKEVFGKKFFEAVETFENENNNFYEEFVDKDGRLCWKDCLNIRGTAYTQQELTQKLLKEKV